MDVLDREELERRFAKALSSMFSKMKGDLVKGLGDPPDVANLPEKFWDEFGAGLSAEITPFLETIFLKQAKALIEATPMGVDWALINKAASDWAKTYTFELVKGINQTSMNALQSAVSSFFEMGWSREDLEEKLTSLFGPVRAEMIGVTEVTRAATQGELAIANELRLARIEMIQVWQTNNDELVCPECGPRHGERINDGIFPPLHPRCRCWINHELPEVG